MFFPSWLRSRKPSSTHKCRRTPEAARKSAAFRPHLESLEGRDLPSFTSPVGYAVGTSPQAAVTADVNGDGALDIITANAGTYNSTTNTYSGEGISVLLGQVNHKGKPTGTFGAAQNFAVGSSPLCIAVGDFNGDGKPDIVTGNRGVMSVLLGNGDGTFRPALNTAVGLGGYVAVADLNGDGKLDLISNSGGVSVLLGNGDGTFRAGPTYAVPTDPIAALSGGGAAAVGDFNGDGKIDVITLATTSVSLMTGNGDGTFNTPQTITSFPSNVGFFSAVTVADFTGDGKLDVAIGSGSYNSTSSELEVDVLPGNGDGTFSAARVFGTNFVSVNASRPVGLMAADVNHDGVPDLIAVGSNTSEGYVALSAIGGGFYGGQVSFMIYVGTTTAVVVGDFNGDGYADVAIVGSLNSGAGSVQVDLWNPKR